MAAREANTAVLVEAAARRGYAEATKESPGYPMSRDWERLPPEWQDHWLRIAAAMLETDVNAELYWREDVWKAKDRALFVGGLCVGSVMHRPISPNGIGHTWLAWLMTDEYGASIGSFLTEQEAKDALADAAVKELGK
jgi:hypothetical protein